MAGGTLAVLAGTALGLLSLTAFVDSGRSEPLALLPSMALSLGGGYAVLFPGISASRCNVRIHRNWRGHPRTRQVPLDPLAGRCRWPAWAPASLPGQ